MLSHVTVRDPDVFRSKVQAVLCQEMSRKCLQSSSETPVDLTRDALNLEKGIFNYSLREADRQKTMKAWDNQQFVSIYVNHWKSVLENLSPPLVSAVHSKTLLPHTIAFMTHQELQPERWAKLIELKSKRDKLKFENNVAAATNMFTCRKCKGKNCTYYMQQVRSADEPMTIYVTCIDCSYRWKTA